MSPPPHRINPSNFLIQKIHYLNASTGLFVNRSVFATFLFLCAFSSLYYIVIFFQKNQIVHFNLEEQIKSKTTANKKIPSFLMGSFEKLYEYILDNFYVNRV